jgi:hypothetical protein
MKGNNTDKFPEISRDSKAQKYSTNMEHVVVPVNGVRLYLQIKATNRPTVHTLGDI